LKGRRIMLTVTPKAETMLKDMLAKSDLENPMVRLFVGGFG